MCSAIVKTSRGTGRSANIKQAGSFCTQSDQSAWDKTAREVFINMRCYTQLTPFLVKTHIKINKYTNTSNLQESRGR
jgi:hypothetical protein